MNIPFIIPFVWETGKIVRSKKDKKQKNLKKFEVFLH